MAMVEGPPAAADLDGRVATRLRAVVFAAMAWVGITDEPWRFADLPSSLRFPIDGITPPDTPGILVGVATAALCVACFFAAKGYRAAMVAAVPLAWWVIGVPQIYGKVNHHHHLLWLAVLFAAMPALSALRWAWPTMGIVYLFPGLAKLAAAEVLVGGDGMHRIVEVHQWAHGWESPMALNVGMGQVAALGTIVFEVGFIFAAFTRWRRGWAAAGLLFHLGVFVMMGIQFWFAAVVLLVLIADRSAPRLNWQPVAVLVLAGAVMAGVAGSHGWPFAPYPPFDRAPGGRTILEVRDAAGSPVPWLPWMTPARRNGLGAQMLADPSRLHERCTLVAPVGGSCWQVRLQITPTSIRVVDEELVATHG